MPPPPRTCWCWVIRSCFDFGSLMLNSLTWSELWRFCKGSIFSVVEGLCLIHYPPCAQLATYFAYSECSGSIYCKSGQTPRLKLFPLIGWEYAWLLYFGQWFIVSSLFRIFPRLFFRSDREAVWLFGLHCHISDRPATFRQPPRP